MSLLKLPQHLFRNSIYTRYWKYPYSWIFHTKVSSWFNHPIRISQFVKMFMSLLHFFNSIKMKWSHSHCWFPNKLPLKSIYQLNVIIELALFVLCMLNFTRLHTCARSFRWMFIFALFLEIREGLSVEVSNATPVAVGGILSACVILIIVVVVLVIR